MSPKRTPVSKKPPKKKRPPDPAPSVPEAATPERIEALVPTEPRLHSQGTTTAVPPPKPDKVDSRESKAALFRWLRWAAGMYYTTDLRGCTIEQLAKHPMFKIVSIYTLAEWSQEDRWVDRRRVNLEQWRRAIENKIGSEVVRAQTEMVSRIRVLFDKVYAKVEASAVEGNTAQLVNSLVKLAELMDTMNDKIARAVIPDMPAQVQSMAAGPAEGAKPNLGQTEARAAAKLVLKMRRDEMREKADRDSQQRDVDAGETVE